MKQLKVNGIVLIESNMGDFDKMLTILTPNFGKISCSAKGARRPKSLLLAGTQFLCFAEYILYKNGDSYIINSVKPIELFYNIRIDLDKLYYATYLTKIICDVTTENQNSYNTLKLFLNTLYTISETNKSIEMIVDVFKLRLLKIIGFLPNVKECVMCKDKQNISNFSFKNNGFLCKECAKQDTGAVQVSEYTQNALKYIIYSEPKKIFSFELSQNYLKELNLVAQIYLNEKLEKEYKVDNKLFNISV